MNQAWYQVASMGFGYLSAAIIALIVLLAFKKYAQDRPLWRGPLSCFPQAADGSRPQQSRACRLKGRSADR